MAVAGLTAVIHRLLGVAPCHGCHCWGSSCACLTGEAEARSRGGVGLAAAPHTGWDMGALVLGQKGAETELCGCAVAWLDGIFLLLK